MVSVFSVKWVVFFVKCNWVVSIHSCLDPNLHSFLASSSSTPFHPPSLTRWCLTPPRTAQCTPSPAPRSRCCGRIRPWASTVVGPGTSGTSHDPSGWWCGAAGGIRTAAEPGPGLFQTCQYSGNTCSKDKVLADWVKRMAYSKMNKLCPKNVMSISQPLCVVSNDYTILLYTYLLTAVVLGLTNNICLALWIHKERTVTSHLQWAPWKGKYRGWPQ